LLSARQAQKPIPELATLQSRIDALESKLSRTKQEANTQHLLLQVLEKLEDSG
jgi:BMFP domain-containing protein YqiC